MTHLTPAQLAAVLKACDDAEKARRRLTDARNLAAEAEAELAVALERMAGFLGTLEAMDP